MPAQQRIIAIADIHGHYRELMALLDKVMIQWDIDASKDIFVFLGDYVDGGPDTKKILDQLIEWKNHWPHWKFLFGNHEGMLLDALPKNSAEIYYHWFNQGGRATKDSYLEGLTEYEKATANFRDMLPDDHLRFLQELDSYYETEDYFFVHGGITPGLSLEENKKEMTKADMAWMREPFIHSEYDWGKKIIFGHTTFREPFVMDNKIGIDMMYHNTGSIAALLLPEEQFILQDSLTEEDLPQFANVI